MIRRLFDLLGFDAVAAPFTWRSLPQELDSSLWKARPRVAGSIHAAAIRESNGGNEALAVASGRPR